MRIDFSKTGSFNKLFFKLNQAKTRFVWNYGGAGSGKSYVQTQYELIQAFAHPIKTLVVRKFASTIKHSVFALFNEILSDWKLTKYIKVNKSDFSFTFPNGSQILCKGIDDPEKIKSIAGLRRIWCEEISELDFEDFKQLNIRLRGSENLQFTGTFNPISEDHWLKKQIFDSEQFNKYSTILRTTYLDNKFIDSAYAAQLELYKNFDYEYYRVYALGEWGRIVTGLEFYKDFKPENMVTKPYNNLLPLHISFDENVNPYMGVTIWQTKGNDLFCIDEITLRAPKNTLNDVLLEIQSKFPAHEAGMFIYGDATSNKSDVKLQRGYNLFTLIMAGLQRYRPVLRVPISNPSVFLRGVFINSIFRGQIAANIYIAEHCTELITDLNRVKLDNGGEKEQPKKVKEKVRDKQTGITFEKYGHTSDSMDYFVCKYLESQYNTFRYGTSNSVPVDKLNFDIDLLKF